MMRTSTTHTSPILLTYSIAFLNHLATAVEVLTFTGVQTDVAVSGAWELCYTNTYAAYGWVLRLLTNQSG